MFVFLQAIIDSAKIGIPTVGIVDSDCNPNIITYPIPGNDDTLDSTQLYLHLFKQAILIGKKKRDENSNDWHCKEFYKHHFNLYICMKNQSIIAQ